MIFINDEDTTIVKMSSEQCDLANNNIDLLMYSLTLY